MISGDRLVSSKRRAEKPLARGLDPRGSAFRLHIVVRTPLLQSLPYPLRLSPRLDLKAARLSLAVYHCRLATRRDTVHHPSREKPRPRPASAVIASISVSKLPAAAKSAISGPKESWCQIPLKVAPLNTV
jgi:hypothetical protein